MTFGAIEDFIFFRKLVFIEFNRKEYEKLHPDNM